MDMTGPVFLRGPGPDALKSSRRRWKKMKAKRPAGDRWETADRWEVEVDRLLGGTTGKGLAFGRRLVWVTEGVKWVHLRDNEDYAKVSLATWRQMQKTGRQVL